MCDIGRKMYNRRKELGLTLEQVGEAVGVGKSTVRRWETGMIKNMGRDKIAALARVLQISPVELVPGGDAGKNTHPKEYSEPDDLERLEALHRRPELRLLFDRARNISHEDVEKFMKMIDVMFPEEDDHDG